MTDTTREPASQPGAAVPAPPAAHRRGPAESARRLAERLLLGSIMALMATLLDRRLRRLFQKR